MKKDNVALHMLMDKTIRDKARKIAIEKWINLSWMIRLLLVEEIKKYEKENWDVNQAKLFDQKDK